MAFKIPNLEIDYSEGKYFDAWDKDQRKYTLQMFFKDKRPMGKVINAAANAVKK